MDKKNLTEQLANLFEEVGAAHHEAFREVDGEDPEWASWYARVLEPRLAPLLEVDLNEAQIAHLLEEMESRREADAPDSAWPAYYAEYLVNRYGPQ